MRKLITLLAAATLVASSLTQAATTATNNPNDPLHQIQPNNASETPTTLADADTSTTTTTTTTDQSTTQAAPVKKHHHKKKHHCNCKSGHCKSHHAKPAVAPASSEAPAATPSTQ